MLVTAVSNKSRSSICGSIVDSMIFAPLRHGCFTDVTFRGRRPTRDLVMRRVDCVVTSVVGPTAVEMLVYTAMRRVDVVGS